MTESPPSSTPPPETPDDAPDDSLQTFATVPGRARRDGWTAERQHDFIASLRKCGSIAQAARAVGKTGQSAYKLRARPGAEDFAAAWDLALGEARCTAFDIAMERVSVGVWEPRFYRGQFTGMRRYEDVRMALAALRAIHASVPAKGEK